MIAYHVFIRGKTVWNRDEIREKGRDRGEKRRGGGGNGAGEFSRRARWWRDRMDNQTDFLYVLNFQNDVQHRTFASCSILSCLTLSYITLFRPESLLLVLFTSYLLFIYLFIFYISFLYEPTIITQFIHLCVRVCFMLFPFHSIQFFCFVYCYQGNLIPFFFNVFKETFIKWILPILPMKDLPLLTDYSMRNHRSSLNPLNLQ